MTAIPMVPAALFAQVWLGPTANKLVHAYSDPDHAKTGDLRRAWGNSKGKPFMMAILHEKAALTPKHATRLGKSEWEPAYHGDHAFFRWGSCQSRRRALGKSNGNPFIMAISPRKSGAYAKTRDLRPPWGNSQRNPFMMAITLFSDRACAKTGDLRPVWEKSNGNLFIMAIAKPSAIRLRESFGLAKPLGLAKRRELAVLKIQNPLRSLLISHGTRYSLFSFPFSAS